jgi:hypothetical protein
MADQFPRTPRKNTVYQGQSAKEPAYTGSSVGVKETVYSGPTRKETVFDASKHVSKKIDTTFSRAAMAKSTRSSAIRFLIVAALSGWEYFSYRGENEGVSTTSLFTCIIFFILAIYAYKMSRGAFLAAIVVYGISTLLMVGAALTSAEGFMLVLKPLIARCILIYNLQQKYCQLTDLYDLENA